MTRSESFRNIKIVGVALAIVALMQLFLASTVEAAPAQAAVPDSYFIKGVPLYAQQHNLSCEYSAARMVTAYWGNGISEGQFIRNIPVKANPHLGFRGNIDGSGGWINDYGIYAEPIANYLETQGFNTRVFYGGVDTLKREISNGHPVMVWVTIALNYATPRSVNINGTSVKLVPGEHSVVVTGYDKSGVYVNGPAEGVRAWFSWSDFLRTWGYFDQMALVITK